MIKIVTLAAMFAVALAAASTAAAESSRCRESCAPSLRECLQAGRPALRTCLRECRIAQPPGACPEGFATEDCPDATGLAECIGGCRDARRIEIRACVKQGTACTRGCQQPAPTPTATPLR